MRKKLTSVLLLVCMLCSMAYTVSFASPADMDGIQQVIDQTLQEEAWRHYGE